MKKALLSLLALAVVSCQFGCSLGNLHNVVVHLLAIGWTADLLNLVP